MTDRDEITDTADQAYTRRLQALSGTGWKRWLDVQAPYRWNLRRLGLGYTLEVGCGIGRNLGHLAGHGVGVDHNAQSVAVCRSLGFTAYTVDEFFRSPDAVPGRFDAILAAHVLEHVPVDAARAIVESYLPYLKPGGCVVLITPQEAGQRSDPSHVHFFDLAQLGSLARALGLQVEQSYSFPFPRLAGWLFKYNEFVLVARKPAHGPQAAPGRDQALRLPTDATLR